MLRYTLTIPRTFNDLTPVEDWRIGNIGARILELAGGFTRTESFGVYAGELTTYSESVFVYTFDAGDDIAGELEALAASVAEELEQESVYITWQTIGARLVKGAHNA